MPREPAASDPGAWLRKADADLASARALLATERDDVLLNACYMAQQCIEKSLKSLLVRRGVEPPRTHDIGHLLRMVDTSGGAPVPWDAAALDDAGAYAFESRYPGALDRVPRSEADAVVELARLVYAAVQ